MKKVRKHRDIQDIFSDVADTDSIKTRQQILLDNDSKALRTLLKFAFDPDLKPAYKKLPKYKPDDSPQGLTYNTLYSVFNQVALFFGKSNSFNL